MNLLYLAAGLLALLLIIYLFTALLKPEWFE